MGISDPGLAGRAVTLPRQADIVVAVSPPLVDSLRSAGVEALLIPNGVDVPHFSRTVKASPDPAAVELGPRRVGFAGHLGDRIDPDLIAAVADRDCTVLLVGPRQRGAGDWLEEVLRRPNVHWLGLRSYADLPSVLAAADVWMLPYDDSAFNRASFPLKLLEYLAAGRRVVATDLPAVRWLDTGLIDVAHGAAGFADAVTGTLGRPLTAAESADRIGFASSHGWTERVRPLAEQMGLST
nr:glycosyltransferase [Kineosporia mesophila]